MLDVLNHVLFFEIGRLAALKLGEGGLGKPQRGDIFWSIPDDAALTALGITFASLCRVMPAYASYPPGGRRFKAYQVFPNLSKAIQAIFGK
jgi:hypothetical protein